MNDYLVRSGNLCAVCHRMQRLHSLGQYCTGGPCYQMYRKHLEIQHRVGSDEAQQLGGLGCWGVCAATPGERGVGDRAQRICVGATPAASAVSAGRG